MKISYRYEPEVSRFWLGVTDGKNFQEFALARWMTVLDLVECLDESVARVQSVSQIPSTD